MNFYLSREAKKAAQVLEAQGVEAFYVGGCVRDNLLGRIPEDFDIATNALPEQILSAFSGYRVIPTGLRHGTVTVLLGERPVEITTYRVDGPYQDCRHPGQVSFTRSLEEDLKRRDFTVNALAYHEKCGVLDFFHGMEDLRSRRLRCVGMPEVRFHEDALRILRALRFASTLGFSIEEATAESIHRCSERLKYISAERIAAEFSKLLCGFGVEQVLLHYGDVICVFIPELNPARGFLQKNKHHIYDVYTHICKTVAHAPPELAIRLTMMFHDIGKPDTFTLDECGVGHFYGHHKVSAKIAKEVMERLRYDRALTERVETLILYHDVTIPSDRKSVKRWMNRLSVPVLQQLMQVKKADTLGKNPRYFYKIPAFSAIEKQIEDILREGECFTLKNLAVNGTDLLSIGIPRGKAVGDMLHRLLEAVINDTLPNEREILLQRAKEDASV